MRIEYVLLLVRAQWLNPVPDGKSVSEIKRQCPEKRKSKSNMHANEQVSN